MAPVGVGTRRDGEPADSGGYQQKGRLGIEPAPGVVLDVLGEILTLLS